MRNVIMYFLGIALALASCQKPTENNYLESKEYKLYMAYNDQVKEELLKFIYVAHEDYSPELALAKRQLSKDIDAYIISNNLIFHSEPSESERVAFLNEISSFIDGQEVPNELKENLKNYWALTFNPRYQELKEDFIRVSNLNKEELITLYKNRF